MISPSDASIVETRVSRRAEKPSARRDSPPPEGPIPYFYDEEFADEARSHLLLGPPPSSGSQAAKRAPKGIPSYLAHLWMTPLMTRHQEFHYFRKLNYLKYLANVELSDQERNKKRRTRSDQIESLEESIIRVRNLIVESNLRLAVSLARRYGETSRVDFDELVSVGNLSLIRASDLFDFRRGLRFSTYAYLAIQRSIFNAIKGSASSRMIEDAEGPETIETISHDAASALWAEKRYEHAQRQVNSLMQYLDPRERQIVMARFGIGLENDGASFRKISREIGVSSTRTAQLYHRSIDRMRKALEEM